MLAVNAVSDRWMWTVVIMIKISENPLSMMDENMNKVLLIFIKNPEPGKVKTRLANSLGDQKALEIYHKLLKLTRTVTSNIDCSRQLWYSEYIDTDDEWDEARYDKRLQSGSDLGERMKQAFASAFKEGFGRAVIIGSDCAQLAPHHLRMAFKGLDDHDIVIGPSRDRGYYLLGMKRLHPRLFEDNEWGRSSVLEDTLSQAKELQLSVDKLPLLNDIDTEKDMIESGKLLQQL